MDKTSQYSKSKTYNSKLKTQNYQKVCVIGLGYIGLPTAALLANRSFYVHGVDVSEEVVNTINQGKIHIVEPDLDTFVKAAVRSGKLKADTKPAKADIFIIAVPTPFNEDHSADLSYVESATRSIAPYVAEGNLVILESTSPVGTTELVEKILKKERPELFNNEKQQIYIAHCPERVLPGKIMIELSENDRIVGGITPEATDRVAEFYSSFVVGEVLKTDARSAELSKLVENSSRDVEIAFANELSMICDKYNVDVWEVIRLANHHPRVNILNPGPGVGGHCIAVDPWFIIDSAPEESILIRTARERNLYKTKWVTEKIKNAVNEWKLAQSTGGSEKQPRVAIMGLAYKANVDDLRESPAVEIAAELKKSGINIVAVEPNIKSHPDFELISLDDAADTADIMVFLVGHREFKELNIPDNIFTLDFCGILHP